MDFNNQPPLNIPLIQIQFDIILGKKYLIKLNLSYYLNRTVPYRLIIKNILTNLVNNYRLFGPI